ncbi:MAG: glutamate--tRNA ligase [Rhizobiaceae bacterium]
MKPVVRFAPSPTGNIHIGNARTALINWIIALREEGTFILRYDDTDRERSKQEYADGIFRDLTWLGIVPDRIERQSDRSDRHEEATRRLKEAGILYPCFETPDELDRKRKRLAARGQPPVYDRAALHLSASDFAALEASGKRPHWRFLLPNHDGDPFAPRRTEVQWDDLIRGPQTVDLSSMSDPVLVREDGTWPYTLTSVVDDVDFLVTHIIRGDDHVSNTGVQISIFQALGAPVPAFGHHNLLTTASGEGLSKRLGSLSLRNLAEDGYEPMAVASLAVLIGGAGAVEPMATMDALAARLDLSAIGKSAAKFDVSELDALNRKLVHAMEWEDVSGRFPADAFEGRGAEFWPAVRENCERARDAAKWWDVVTSAAAVISDEDRDYIAMARETLPYGALDTTSWQQWTAELKTRSGRKGRELFMPLRRVLTGLDHGPDMARLLPIIGRERILARLP